MNQGRRIRSYVQVSDRIITARYEIKSYDNHFYLEELRGGGSKRQNRGNTSVGLDRIMKVSDEISGLVSTHILVILMLTKMTNTALNLI